MGHHLWSLILGFYFCALVLGCGLSGTGKESQPAGHSALLGEKEELANLQPNPASGPSSSEMVEIKGKAVIVRKDSNGEITFVRDHSGLPIFPPEVYAKTPDEIDTLVKIECREHKGEARYVKHRFDDGRLLNYTNTICAVSIIDFKSKNLIAQVVKGTESPPWSLQRDGDNDQAWIYKDVGYYLARLPLELAPYTEPTPAGDLKTAAEIIQIEKTWEDSMSKSPNPEITLIGWGKIGNTSDPTGLYGMWIYPVEKWTDAERGISCEMYPRDEIGFASKMKAGKTYKITVTGTLARDCQYSVCNLEIRHCRLISAEPRSQK